MRMILVGCALAACAAAALATTARLAPDGAATLRDADAQPQPSIPTAPPA
jgi:hypothetical protein